MAKVEYRELTKDDQKLVKRSILEDEVNNARQAVRQAETNHYQASLRGLEGDDIAHLEQSVTDAQSNLERVEKELAKVK